MSETASMPRVPENVHLAETTTVIQRIAANKVGRVALGIVAAVGIGAATYGAVEVYHHAFENTPASSSGATPGAVPKITGKLDPNCSNPSLAPQTYPGQSNEVLPATKLSAVNNTDKAATYVESLFSNGSLGKNVDPGAEAIVWSVTGSPANSNGVSAENDVIGTAATAYSQMTSPNAKNNIKAAEAYCQQDLNTMALTIGYSDTAIAKGTKYTRLDPALNGNNQITGISKLDQITATTNEAGITFVVKNPNGNRASGGQLNGFYEVVIPTNGNGEVDVLGGLPISSNSKNQSKNAKSSSGSSSTDKKAGKQPNGVTPQGGVTTGGTTHENQPGIIPEYTPPNAPDNTPSSGNAPNTPPQKVPPIQITVPKPTTTTTTTTTTQPTTTTTTTQPTTTTTTQPPDTKPGTGCGVITPCTTIANNSVKNSNYYVGY